MLNKITFYFSIDSTFLNFVYITQRHISLVVTFKTISFEKILRPPSCLITVQNLAPFSQLDRATGHAEYCQLNYGHLVYISKINFHD